jgi:hypothetical protein
MSQYLLSVHSVDGEARDPMSEEEMQQFMERVGVLEEEMKSAGAWLFGGALHEPDTATVVRVSDGEVLTTDGPFAESKEHLGGFYIIEADDLDAALAWRRRRVEQSQSRSKSARSDTYPRPDNCPTPYPSSRGPRSAGSSARSPAAQWRP